ncbi:MAG: glycosyltransferase family 4 protein, partial [Methermicoccaceae archaeon]
MGISRIRVLFVRPYRSSFIQRDLELLKRHFDVRVVDSVLSRKKPHQAIKSLFKLAFGILWADVSFSWFADAHALFAVIISRLFRRKSVVVVGGYEVAAVPEVGYGLMLRPLSRAVVKYVLNHADKVLAVSKFSMEEALKYTHNKGVELVYNGVGSAELVAKDEKENLVLTVSAGDSWERARLKGLDVFVKSASLLRDVSFLVIGTEGDALKRLREVAPPNVAFAPLLSWDELVSYYQRARVYCQLSMRESFGVALAEAMLCECVPVVSDRGALLEVVGDTGFYAPYG